MLLDHQRQQPGPGVQLPCRETLARIAGPVGILKQKTLHMEYIKTQFLISKEIKNHEIFLKQVEDYNTPDKALDEAVTELFKK